MVMLFMRSPLTAAVGTLPTIMQSKIALQALAALNLTPYREGFHHPFRLPENWREIRLENITYRHPAQGGDSFGLEPVNLTLTRGQTVFLIGSNGSGKSTLSMLLTGLYPPDSGKIYVDGTEITPDTLEAHRRLFTAVFTDFYLFDHLTDGKGNDVAERLLDEWLHRLFPDKSIRIENRRILNSRLSQGQRKRLALLAAALEQRSVLVLDEWAADQDPHFRRIFYETLLPLLKQQGYTVFAISHDNKYFHHADRILSMQNGRLSEYTAAAADAYSRGGSYQSGMPAADNIVSPNKKYTALARLAVLLVLSAARYLVSFLF